MHENSQNISKYEHTKYVHLLCYLDNDYISIKMRKTESELQGYLAMTNTMKLQQWSHALAPLRCLSMTPDNEDDTAKVFSFYKNLMKY